jgi:hypothetical protein
MREIDQFVGGQFSWFTGVVEDTNDISNLGRVKVRCFGYHTHDAGILSTEDLPWATVILPTTSAGVDGIGTNHRLLSGSWVVGFFRDGPSAQDPLIIGSIASQTETVREAGSGFTGSYPTEIGLDMPLLARDKSTSISVTHTPGGHTIELDDTIDAEQIVVTHVSGSFIRLHQDGTVSISSSNQTVNIIGNTTVTGTVRASDEITAKYIGEESVTLTGHTHNTSDPSHAEHGNDTESDAPTDGT